jgi:hypothetical protein
MLLAPLVTAATLQIMAPHWDALDCPVDLAGGVDALPTPNLTEPSAAVYAAASLATATSLKRALQLWPIDASTGAGMCGVDATAADVYTVVKLLAGADPHASATRGNEVIGFCCARLSEMPHDTHAAVLAWAVMDGSCQVECPAAAAFLASGGANPLPEPLPLHPAAKLRMLDDLTDAVDALAVHIPRDAAAAAIREARLWRVAAGALAAAGDADAAAALAEAPMLLEACDSSFEIARECAAAGCPAESAQIAGARVLEAGGDFSVVVGVVRSVAEVYIAADDAEGALADSGEIVRAVYEAHVATALAALRHTAEHDAEDAEASGARGLWHVELAVQSLSGDTNSLDEELRAQVRKSVVHAMHEVHVSAPAAQLQRPLMHALMQLQASLAAPENWGISGGAAPALSVLGSRTRATLGAAFPDAEGMPADGATSSPQAAAELFHRFLESAVTQDQLLSLYVLLSDVWGFGKELPGGAGPDSPDPVRMHACAESLAAKFAALECLPECLNLLHMRIGEARARCVSVDGAAEVAAAVDAACGPVATCAARLVAEVPALVDAALATLSTGEFLDSPMVTDRDEKTGKSTVQRCGATAAAAVLLGLRTVPVRRVQRTLCERSAFSVVQAMIRNLPLVGATRRVAGGALGGENAVDVSTGGEGVALRVETALPEFLVWLCLEGHAGGMMLAGSIVADYVGMHEGMRDASAEIAMLRRYLVATRARLAAAESGSGGHGLHACLLPGLGGDKEELLVTLSETIGACEEALSEVF